jgi:hypothetical protein
MIDADHPQFSAIRERWIKEGRPGEITFDGVIYRELDNGTKFTPKRSKGTLDQDYSSDSLRGTDTSYGGQKTI